MNSSTPATWGQEHLAVDVVTTLSPAPMVANPLEDQASFEIFKITEKLKQENADLLATVAALESEQALVHRILAYRQEKIVKKSIENECLIRQVGYLEECVQSARLKEETAIRLEKARSTHKIQFEMLQRNRGAERRRANEKAKELKDALVKLEEVTRKEEETAARLENARSSFQTRFGITQRSRGAARRRANEKVKELEEALVKIDEVSLNYQKEKSSKVSAIQSFRTTMGELKTTKAQHAAEKRQLKDTARLMANANALNSDVKRLSEKVDKLQEEGNIKDNTIHHQNQTIQEL